MNYVQIIIVDISNGPKYNKILDISFSEKHYDVILFGITSCIHLICVTSHKFQMFYLKQNLDVSLFLLLWCLKMLGNLVKYEVCTGFTFPLYFSVALHCHF